MKKISLFLFLQIFMISIGCAAPIKVILDTDMDSDIDDVSALALLHHFADLGEVEILGTISCSSKGSAVEVIDAINTFYNRPDIPVAVPKNCAPQHSWILNGGALAKEFPHDATAANSPSAVKLYRKLLASQPDKSVVIVTLGYLNNLEDLLLSKPDEHSPLNGYDLVASKVASFYCMGSLYPVDNKPADIVWGNFRPDPASTLYVVQHWPTKIVFTGGGDFASSIGFGNGLKTLPNNNIVRRAYELAKGDTTKSWDHHAADIVTVWVAVRGTSPYFQETTYGYNEIDQYGRNKWKTDRDIPTQSYVSSLKKGVNPKKVGSMFDSLFQNFSASSSKKKK